MFKKVLQIILIISICLLQVFAKDDVFYEPIDGQLPFFIKKDINPIWDLSKLGDQKLIRLPSHQVQNQYSKEVSTGQFRGKVLALSFFFATCSGYCPMMTNNIKRVFSKLKNKEDYLFLSYSVTPTKDKAETLNLYANKYGINNSNWWLIRGDRKTIYDVARNHLQADMALDLKLNKDQFVHSESVYLIDQNLYLRGVYNANSPKEMEKLLRDMRHLRSL